MGVVDEAEGDKNFDSSTSDYGEEGPHWRSLLLGWRRDEAAVGPGRDGIVAC